MGISAIRQGASDWWNAPPVAIEKTEKSDLNALMLINAQEEVEAALDKSFSQDNQLVLMYVIALKRINGKAHWNVMMQKEIHIDQYKKYNELAIQSMQSTAWWAHTYATKAGALGIVVNTFLLPVALKPILTHKYEPFFSKEYTWIKTLDKKSGFPFNIIKGAVSLVTEKHALSPEGVKKWDKQITSQSQQVFGSLGSFVQLQQTIFQGPTNEYHSKGEQSNKKVDALSGRKNEIDQNETRIFQMLEQLGQQLAKLNDKTNQAG